MSLLSRAFNFPHAIWHCLVSQTERWPAAGFTLVVAQTLPLQLCEAWEPLNLSGP